MTANESSYHALAERLGLIYNGKQKNPHGSDLPMFTHPEFGTFVMHADESLQQAIERKRVQFMLPTSDTKAQREVK